MKLNQDEPASGLRGGKSASITLLMLEALRRGRYIAIARPTDLEARLMSERGFSLRGGSESWR